jgi:hypothetical protein
MSTAPKQALGLFIQDKEGRSIGGLVILDQGNRRLPCDWYAGCVHHAVVAVIPREPTAAPQLACGTHLAAIHLSIWQPNNPPRFIIKNVARMLARNDKVAA